jgi:signal transduction histidine kinase
MNRLIEDLLEIVRQESGQMTLNIEDVPAASIISQTAEMFQSAAMERGISLRATDASPDLAVRSDQGRIIQVMSNLVGNALKFVPSGGTVVLDAKREDGEVVFSVNDSGPGIPPEDLHRLFERFWQRRRDDKRGVGLGLTIARGIVEAHGGRIWAESQLGHGATFYFTLPSAAERSARPAIATQSVPEINSRPLPAAPALQITA